MSPEKQREIASKGGRAAHEKGTAHEWTADEARSAGRKGGQVSRGGRGRLVPSDGAATLRRTPKRPPAASDSRRPRRMSRCDRADRRLWRRQTMVRRVAVAWCSRWRSHIGGDRERADRIFRDIHGAESASTQTSRRRPTTRRRRRDRRRRRSSATLGCGLCRPPRCSRTVSGRSAATGAARTTSRASPTSATSPARSRVGIRDRAEVFGSFLFDTRIDRDLRPALRQRHRRSAASSIAIRGCNQVLDRRQRRRLATSARKVNLLSEFRQSPVALARARHGEGADRRRRDVGVSTGKADFLVDFIGSKEVAQVVEVSGYARLRIARRAGRLRHAGRRVPVGRRRSGFPSRSPAARHARAERRRCRRDDATISGTASLVGVDGSVAPLRGRRREA